ncbi:N-formylglutamate deformylase [Caulobacter segnis]
MSWLRVVRGQAPPHRLSPHTGREIPPEIEARLVSPWLARKDADWWVDRLYAFAEGMGATMVRTAISRTVIDVNRDPSGASLYPGQATTELCPTTTFDGEPLYRGGQVPDAAEIERRRIIYFEPYHAALRAEIDRLRVLHPTVVLYEAHAIRSRVPRLFDGELPQFNLGTNSGLSCASALTAAVEAACDASGRSRVTNGRFKGGWTTRCYGQPATGVHAIQMELACRGYMDDPAEPPTEDTWPPPFHADRAEPLRLVLEDVLNACLHFARAQA